MISDTVVEKEYGELKKHIAFYHEPKDKPLEIRIANNPESKWVEISPQTPFRIVQLSFNPGSSLIGKTVPEGLAEVSHVKDAECIELRIGSTNYKIFAKPQSQLPNIADCSIPGSYHIRYNVQGGAWNLWDDRPISPAEQLQELDKSFQKLKKCADLYYPISRANNLHPYISLTFSRLEDGIAYVELKYLPQDGHGSFLCACIKHVDACLEHILFQQKADFEKDRAVVLGIHGGVEAYIHIGNVRYILQMDSRNKTHSELSY